MIRLLALLLALAPLAACSTDSHEPQSETAGGFGGPIPGDLLAAEANEDGTLEIGITTDVLFLRLTERARAEAQKELDTELPEDGIGGAIGRAVSGFAVDALASAGRFPLDQIDALRYENDRLHVIPAEGGSDLSFNDGEESGLAFEEDAARRLIVAFEKAK